MCTEVCETSSDRCHVGGAWVGEGQVCKGLKMEEAAFKLDRVEKDFNREGWGVHEKKIVLMILSHLIKITPSVKLQCWFN